MAATLDGLGVISERAGDFAAARSRFDQALSIRKKLFGENHSETARSFSNLGHLLKAMGQDEVARSYYEQDVRITKAALGADHPATATSLGNLAFVQVSLGNRSAAARTLDEARHSVRRHTARILIGLSEREQLVFLYQTDRAPLHCALSLAMQHSRTNKWPHFPRDGL